MWAIVSKAGMEGRPHMHSGKVSGAYYVDAGACDDTGIGWPTPCCPTIRAATIAPVVQSGLRFLQSTIFLSRESDSRTGYTFGVMITSLKSVRHTPL